VFLKCVERKPSGFCVGLRSKTAGIAALFQGFDDKKPVKKTPVIRRRAFGNTPSPAWRKIAPERHRKTL
jgi:hypothetical protein